MEELKPITRDSKFYLPSNNKGSEFNNTPGYLRKNNYYLLKGILQKPNQYGDLFLFDVGLASDLKISKDHFLDNQINLKYPWKPSTKNLFFPLSRFSVTQEELISNSLWAMKNLKHSKVWVHLVRSLRKRLGVEGRVLNKVKGGLSIGLAGRVGFYPKSQISQISSFTTRRNIQKKSSVNRKDTHEKLLGTILHLYISKMSKPKSNIVAVSTLKGSKLWKKLRSLDLGGRRNSPMKNLRSNNR